MIPHRTVGDMSLTSPLVLPTPHDDLRHFHVRMAYACALVAIAGFIPTYWAPVASRTFGGPPILHVHGLLFSAWPVLFIAQARLAAAGRFERHRAIGFVGISLATAMLFAGIAAVIHSLKGASASDFEPQARAFAIVPLSIVLSFAGLVAAALANVRRPEVHMRLMLAASITVLPPAIARILFLFLAPEGSAPPGQGEPPTVAFALLPSFLANLLLVIAMVHDWRRRGRPHSAYLIAGACIVTVQIARIPLSSTTPWHGITTWLLAFGG
ncbi:MAG: hypothetical protein JJE40_18120 [Vicinamibacteria bacterium]|nr:hypothetical protein [Vicinamibacteria bacterium]